MSSMMAELINGVSLLSLDSPKTAYQRMLLPDPAKNGQTFSSHQRRTLDKKLTIATDPQ